MSLFLMACATEKAQNRILPSWNAACSLCTASFAVCVELYPTQAQRYWNDQYSTSTQKQIAVERGQTWRTEQKTEIGKIRVRRKTSLAI
jgi:hypothetical protein